MITVRPGRVSRPDPDALRRTLAYLDHAAAVLADHAANAPELVNHLGHWRELASGLAGADGPGRALDELERLGDRYACPRGYWLCLRQAAANMGLTVRLPGYDRRLRSARRREPSP